MYNELYNLFSLHEGKLFLQVDPPGGIYSQLSLRQRDTLGDGTICPSLRDVRLIESQLTRDQLWESLFQCGVHLLEMSVKRVDCICVIHLCFQVA